MCSEDNPPSLMEAFMPLNLPPQSTSSTTQLIPTKRHYPLPPVTTTQDRLHNSLQSLISGAREHWNYAIFWQSDVNPNGLTSLGWGDGYYKFEYTNSTSFDPVQQEHRKKVLRELNSLISGGAAETNEDVVEGDVTDTEWFYLCSMTQTFGFGVDLPGQAYQTSNLIWAEGMNGLWNLQSERARQGAMFGLRTIVCIPSRNGVLELGSTELIVRSQVIIDRIKVDLESLPLS